MSSLIQRMFAVAAVASAVLSLSAGARAQGHWAKLAPLPERSEEFSFVDANGKIYLFGGLPSGTTPPKGLVQEYDPATDKWTQKKNMPLPTHHASVASYGGKIYVFGGATQLEPGGPTQVPINNTWEYDAAADSWRALAPDPIARMAAVAVEVGGKIYVMGGASVHPGAKLVSIGPTTPHRSLDTNEVYDPTTNNWESRSPMPTARNHPAAGVVGGRIYVIGGRLGSGVITTGSNTDIVEEYDPATDGWGYARARMPTPRSGMGWATYKGRIYVAGGEIYDSHEFAAMRAFEAYDPATNQWSVLPSLPAARHGVNVAAIGNRIYVIGGHLTGDGSAGEKADSDANDAFEFVDK